MPENLTLSLPNATKISYLIQNATNITGSATGHTITIEFTDKVTDMASMLYSQKAYEYLCLKGSTKKVTDFGYFSYVSNLKMTEDSDPIDLTSATTIAQMLGYGANTFAHLRFKPNTRTLSSSSAGDGITAYNINLVQNADLISFANALVSSGGATKEMAVSAASTKLNAIVGRVESRTDETGTYDFFVEDANGTYTLTDFITTVKGWTIV